MKHFWLCNINYHHKYLCQKHGQVWSRRLKSKKCFAQIKYFFSKTDENAVMLRMIDQISGFRSIIWDQQQWNISIKKQIISWTDTLFLSELPHSVQSATHTERATTNIRIMKINWLVDHCDLLCRVVIFLARQLSHWQRSLL